MMRNEIRKMVISVLKDTGPMSVKQISEALRVPGKQIEGAIRSLHLSGKVEIVKKDRRNGCVWQIS